MQHFRRDVAIRGLPTISLPRSYSKHDVATARNAVGGARHQRLRCSVGGRRAQHVRRRMTGASARVPRGKQNMAGASRRARHDGSDVIGVEARAQRSRRIATGAARRMQRERRDRMGYTWKALYPFNSNFFVAGKWVQGGGRQCLEGRSRDESLEARRPPHEHPI